MLSESMMMMISIIKNNHWFENFFSDNFWLQSCQIKSLNKIRSYHAELNVYIEVDLNTVRANDVYITITIIFYENYNMLEFKSTFDSINNWWFSLKERFDVYKYCHRSFILWLHNYICYIEIIVFVFKSFSRWVLKIRTWLRKD